MMMFSALQFASIAASSSVGSWLRQGDLRSSMLNFRLTFTFVIPLRKYTHSAVLAKVQRMEKTLLAFYQLSRSRDGMNDKRLNPSPIQITSQAFSGLFRATALADSLYLSLSPLVPPQHCQDQAHIDNPPRGSQAKLPGLHPLSSPAITIDIKLEVSLDLH